MGLKRILIVAAIAAIGAAAPARAWCEAICLAPTARGESHCPSHDPADGKTTISAAGLDECPALEAARPATPARLDINAPGLTGYLPAALVRTHFTPSFPRPQGARTLFQRSTPLRI